MILVVVLLHAFYALCLSFLTDHKRVALDGFSKCALGAYHAIWATWIIEAFWHIKPVPSAQVLMGAVFFLYGALWAVWAMASNPFFSPNLCKPDKIVQGGAYAYMRHPAYCGFSLMSGGTFLILGHTSGAFFLLAYWAMLLYRIKRENELLYSK